MSISLKQHYLGGALCIAVGFLGMAGAQVSPLDPVTTAILLGAVIGNIWQVPSEWHSGIVWSEKKLLGVAIALYGLKLDVVLLKDLGWSSFLMIIGTMTVTLLLARPAAKVLKLDETMGLTIGIGTAVCGSAAIGATKDIIKADEAQVGMGIAVINFVGTLGIFALPLLGLNVLEYDALDNGFLIGNSLQAVGQVVAAGFSVSEETGQVATVVKMGRVLMLTPIIVILLKRFQDSNGSTDSLSIPWFILGFVFFSIIASMHILPEASMKQLGSVAKVLLIISMAGIGLKISIGKIRDYGLSALYAATVLFVIQLGCSIGLLMLF